MEQFRARFDKWREERGESPDARPEQKAVPPSQEKSQRAGPEIVPATDLESRQQAFRERYAAHQKEREPVVPEQKLEPQPEKRLEQDQEKEKQREIHRGFGIGM